MSEIDEKEIKRRFEVISQFEPSLKVTARDLERVRESLTEQASRQQVTGQRLWRIIMKSRMTKLAAVAVIIISVIVVLHNGLIDNSAAAYAKVIESVRNVPWMRISYTSKILDENGNIRAGDQWSTDIWYSFNSQILIQKYSFGLIIYNDYSKQEVHTYNPDSKRIVISALSGNMPLEANSPWSWLERNIQRMIPFGGDVSRKTGQYDGKEVEVFEIVSAPKAGMAAVRGKIFVDRVTSLPIAAIAEERVYINTKIGKPQRVEKGIFEYPELGPSDIYDVGLSRDIPTVNSLPLPPWREINRLYQSCRRRSPEIYIAIVTRELRILGAPIESVEICYTDGVRSRDERHFLFQPGPVGVQWREQAKEIGNTFDSILKWAQACKTRGEISISISYESCFYNSHRQDDGTWTTTEQIFEGIEFTPGDFWSLCPITRIGWPQIRGYADIIQDDYARENNLIRIEVQGRQFYLNPDRDYICQRRIDTYGRSTDVKEFAQTIEGKWYPRRIEGPGIANTIYLETNPVFPEGIFDPNNLPKEID